MIGATVGRASGRSLLIRLACVGLLAASVVWGSGCEEEDAGAVSVRIGAVLPLSGERASYGRDALNGILAGVEKINRQGGVQGRRLDLLVADNRSRPEDTVDAVRDFDARRVAAVIGPLASQNAEAAAAVAEECGVPLVLPAATLTGVTRAGEYVSRICFTNRFQAQVVAYFAREFLRARTFAVVVEAESDYSLELARFFVEAVRADGGEILWRGQYRPAEPDFDHLVRELSEFTVDAVFLPGYSGEVRAFLDVAGRRGLEIPILGGDGWDVPSVAASPGAGRPVSYFAAHFAAGEPDDAVRDFVSTYDAKYGYAPHSLAALGYDAVWFVADALGRASGDTRGDLRHAINSTRGFQGLTGTLSLDARRDGVKSAVIMKTTGRGFEFIDRIGPDRITGAVRPAGSTRPVLAP